MSATLERLQYGFDRDSRRTWRRRALTTGEDNAYGYDGLSQVTQAALGNLNQNASAISAVPAEAEAWDYDPTGNWRGYHIDANGAVILDQQRVHDKGNRLTQIDNDPSPVLLDRAGRMTQVSPDASGDWNESQQITWDAWGRITQIKRASDGAVLGAYSYDGLGRRGTRTVGGTTTRCYYSDQWRPLEERKNDETTAATQYYWGARHRDDLVRRDRATTDGGPLDKTRYVLMDYFSPAAITDQAGTVTERYAFSTFGIRRILAPDFSPRTTSECAFEFAFQGQLLDTESGFLDYGYRYYSPALGRWLNRDPIQEMDSRNLYGFVNNEPVGHLDLLGLATAADILTFKLGPLQWNQAKAWFRDFYTYHYRANFEIEVKCSENQMRISQFKRGLFEIASERESLVSWTPDGQYDIWNDTSYSGQWSNIPHTEWKNGSLGGRSATWYDQPGIYGVGTAEFPVYYGGAGEMKWFDFRTEVSDANTGKVLKTINWGILIQYQTPNAGFHDYYRHNAK